MSGDLERVISPDLVDRLFVDELKDRLLEWLARLEWSGTTYSTGRDASGPILWVNPN